MDGAEARFVSVIIFILLPLSVLIATGFFVAFVWAVRSGQYEDTCTPSMRLLLEENETSRKQNLEQEHGND